MNMNRRDFMLASAGAVAGLALTGCQGRGRSSRTTTVFHNGIVLPVDASFSEHTSFAIRDNQILAVGNEADVRQAAGSSARFVDLGGRTVLPGFIEPHMHFALLAGIGHFADIGPFQKETFDDALDALRDIHKEAAAAGAGDWVTARQFDPILLEPPRDLTTKDLDKVASDRPAFILNASGHIAYVNSKTLELGGITKDTRAPDGSSYGHFEDGTPNGVIYGQAAFLPLLFQNEALLERMESGFIDAGRGVGDQAAALGITTLCDQATGALSGPGELDLYAKMYEGGSMKARVRAYLYDERASEWEESGVRPGDGDAFMQVSGWKMVTDGSNQGFTGRQREPYYRTDEVGMFYIEPADLQKRVSKRAGQGWPLALHGNGDAAIDSILDSLENAKGDGTDVRSLRPRIEHCSILHDDQIARMQELGVCPSFLINHVHYWGHVMRDQVFGPEKVLLLDRCASVERAGLRWVIHTDAPVSPLGSLHKVRTAVVRDIWKEQQTILAPEECVSVETALRSITRDAAWLCHSEDEIGSLEAGKLADFVILEEDPRKTDPRQISDITIRETWMDGRQVFANA